MAKWQYTKGLHDLGNGCFAWLQPDGSWGWSNAGLIADRDQTLLVDTLFDLKLTAEMLDQMRAAVPAARSIGRLVNTHPTATTRSATSSSRRPRSSPRAPAPRR
jgi:cyclase